jgi:phosphoribosylanthranilate isomerase
LKHQIKLKVCGMRDAKNILEVAALSPDFMGFIFYPKSPRYVGESFQVPAEFPTNIIRVGVFVNESTEVILAQCERHKLGFLQLHGEESVQQCLELKNRNLKIIKVLSVDDTTSFEITKFYSEAVDFFLFDTKGKYYGGNAKTFRWQRLEQYDQSIPFFLSGGLSPENVDEIRLLEQMNLYALDINSGVESSPAMKNTDKIRSIQESLNRINNRTKYEIQG